MFDMGLRTLTLTIIKCINSLMTVVNSSTTYEVGGAYLDNLLVSVLREECKRFVQWAHKCIDHQGNVVYCNIAH